MKNREKTKEQLIKELKESWQTNEFLSLLLESMPVAVYTCKAGGDFGATYISKNIAALTGYKPKDFTSNSEFWFDNIHHDDQQMVNINLATLLDTGNITYEYRWRVADGSYKWFYDISKLMKSPSGETSYILGTWVDITERKSVEDTVNESEKKMRIQAEELKESNVALKVLMKQSTATLDVVQKTFNLTDQEKMLLLDSAVGEGIFFAGQKHVAIKVIASYTEDQIITTSPSQVAAKTEGIKKKKKVKTKKAYQSIDDLRKESREKDIKEKTTEE